MEAVGLAAVDIKHGDGSKGGTEGGEAEDEHRGGVGRVGLVGAAYTHGDDGASEILDEKDHRVSRTQAFQGDDFRYAGPEGGRCQGVADAQDDHQGDGYRRGSEK